MLYISGKLSNGNYFLIDEPLTLEEIEEKILQDYGKEVTIVLLIDSEGGRHDLTPKSFFQRVLNLFIR